LHEALVRNEDVRAGRFDTQWLEAWLDINASCLEGMEEVAAL